MLTLKNTFYPLFAVILIASLGCNKKAADTVTVLTGTWTKQSTFDGDGRGNGAGYVSASDTFYYGTGIGVTTRMNDFWAFDIAHNNWLPKRNFPGAGRSGAVGFNIGDKGYIGTGYDGRNYLNDFYEFDPTAGDSGKWTKVASFPGSGRQGAVAFSINGFGYVGTGFDGGYKKDFWKFSPPAFEGDSGKWVSTTSISGDKRTDAFAFVIDNIAYVGFGTNNGQYINDLWAFDPSATPAAWTSKAAPAADTTGDGILDLDARSSGAAAFVINKKGYVATGYYGGYILSTWEFNPYANVWPWKQRINFAGSGRQGATGFSTSDGKRGFLIGGKNGSAAWDDFWEFTP